jgi:4-hydroxybenzoate polyprenyltransferase
VTSLAYTLILKRLMMIDVVTLACLYGVRLVLGAVGADVKLTAWLAAFSLFLFFSLALVKRTAELAHRKTPGPIAGRSYMAGDEPLLAALASASGMVSVLVFALYVNSPEVRVLYHAPNHLWFICVVLLYWIGRVLMLSHRGEMHADPVVFAVTDKISLISILVAGAILVSAL